MIRMFRYLFLFLILNLLGSPCAWSANISLTPSRYNLASGENFSLAINIDNATDVTGVAFTLRYPPNALALDATQPVVTQLFLDVEDPSPSAAMPVLSPWVANTDTPGTILFSAAYINPDPTTGGGGNFTGPQTLFTVNFSTLNDTPLKKYQITLSATKLCNGPAGWGTDLNNNGKCDVTDGDIPQSVPVIVKAYGRGTPQWNTLSLLDDFEIAGQNFSPAPSTTIRVLASTADSDNDGISDAWENLFGLTVGIDDSAADMDGDGLTNLDEYIQGTFPDKVDSDEDGMDDLWEIDQGLNPLSNDTLGDINQDGISNYQEYLSITGTKISGRVTNQGGQPLQGISVEAVGAANLSWHLSTTDANGYYHLYVNPAADYRVMIPAQQTYRTAFFNNASNWDDADPLDLTNTPVVDIDFVLVAGVEISGTITGLNKDDTAMIEAWSEKTQSWAGRLVQGNGEDIPYTLYGLAPAKDYRIRVSADRYKGGYLTNSSVNTPNTGKWEEAELIAGGTNNVNINLMAGRTISGTLSNLSNGDYISIYAQSSSTGNWGSTWVKATSSEVDYTITGLAQADDYVVSIYSTSYMNGYYSGTPGTPPVARAMAAELDTTNDHATGVDLVMELGKTISGTVSGLQSGDRAWVNAWSPSSGVSTSTALTGTGTILGYQLPGVSSSQDYRVSVNADKYVGGYYSEGGTVLYGSADPVNTLDNDAIGIDLEVYIGKSISGTITGLKKNERANMSAWSSSSRTWKGTSVIGTGSDITYHIEGLIEARDYTINFQPDNHAKETKTGISSANNPTNINFIAQASNSISGTISGAGGRAQINIEARSPSTNDWGRAYVNTDVNGNANYTIKGLNDANDYRVTAVKGQTKLFYNDQGTTADWSQATFVDLSNGSVTGKDINFSSFLTYTLSGSISGLNNNERVWIDAWDESSWMLGGGERVGNGNFSIDLLTGNYKLGLYADGYLYSYYASVGLATADSGNAGVIDLTNSSQAVGQLTLIPANSFSGTVSDNTGTPLAGIYVELSGTIPQNNGLPFNTGAITDSEGQFVIDGLANDSYTITIYSHFGTYTGLVTLNSTNITGHTITLGAINNAAGALRGTITQNAMPAANALVILTDEGGLFINAWATDENGQFSFAGLTPGTYTASFDLDTDGFFDASCQTDVTANKTTDCDLSL